MSKYFLFLSVLLLSTSAFADGGYIVTSATVTTVTNTANNQDVFAIQTSGGESQCQGAWIQFYSENAGNSKIHDRAYAAALSAFASGAKVSIFDYHEPISCKHAEYIQLFK